MKCMVCGCEAPHRIPLSFCKKCEDSEKAEKVRREFEKWFSKVKVKL